MNNDFIKMLYKSIEHIKKNKGAIMRTCSQLKGKADMKMVSEIVNNILI